MPTIDVLGEHCAVCTCVPKAILLQADNNSHITDVRLGYKWMLSTFLLCAVSFAEQVSLFATLRTHVYMIKLEDKHNSCNYKMTPQIGFILQF